MDNDQTFGDGDTGTDSDGAYSGPLEPAGDPFEPDAGHPPALDD